MKKIYNALEISVICLDCYDCIRTSDSSLFDYGDNELPLVPFE